jgi:hypothetical protein
MPYRVFAGFSKKTAESETKGVVLMNCNAMRKIVITEAFTSVTEILPGKAQAVISYG